MLRWHLKCKSNFGFEVCNPNRWILSIHHEFFFTCAVLLQTLLLLWGLMSFSMRGMEIGLWHIQVSGSVWNISNPRGEKNYQAACFFKFWKSAESLQNWFKEVPTSWIVLAWSLPRRASPRVQASLDTGMKYENEPKNSFTFSTWVHSPLQSFIESKEDKFSARGSKRNQTMAWMPMEISFLLRTEIWRRIFYHPSSIDGFKELSEIHLGYSESFLFLRKRASKSKTNQKQ